MNAIARLKAYRGPVLLSYGFRPFFLFGALYAALAVLAWLPILNGRLELWTAFGAVDWHVHEMLYGFLPAVIAGFLLTAIPNWTGRLPIQGQPLLVLVLLWLAGRGAVTFSSEIGWLAAGLIDVAFLTMVVAATTREIIAGSNWRNLKVVGLVALLLVGNIAFHLEAHIRGSAEYGTRIGIAVTVTLIAIIGGRIVPSFTRNWLMRENPGRLPVPFARFDVMVILFSAAALALWCVLPSGQVTAVMLAIAGVLHVVRMLRWAGDRTGRDRLVLILHVGYLFVPLGFLLVAAGAAGFVMADAGIHAWMVGAAGVMTLAVMTRASLGHTGKALVATPATQMIYAAVVIAALARICLSVEPRWGSQLLDLSAIAWCAAFFGFVVVFGPLLFGASRQMKSMD